MYFAKLYENKTINECILLILFKIDKHRMGIGSENLCQDSIYTDQKVKK